MDSGASESGPSEMSPGGQPRYLLSLLGRPGSGKSSAAEAFSGMHDVKLISVSDLLRNVAGNDREIADRMDRGAFVSTEAVTRMLEAEIQGIESRLVIVDGFPRRKDQVGPLYSIARATEREFSLLIVLALPRALAEKRLTGRRVCSECGRVYNIHYDPPPDEACSDCGGRLERREDDRPEVVRSRQERFDRTTRSVIRWFGSHRPQEIRCLRASGSPEAVRRRLVGVVRSRHPGTVPEHGPNSVQTPT